MNPTLLVIILVIEIIVGSSATVHFLLRTKNDWLKILILFGGQALTILLVGLTLRWLVPF